MKRKITRAGILFLSIMLLPLILSGCGLFGNSDTTTPPIDPPLVQPTGADMNGSMPSADGVNGNEVIMTDKVLYLLDPHGYVVPMTMKIPYTEGIAKQVLTYMVKGGPVEKQLPPGFSAVLPAGTQFDMDINTEKGTAIVDFSKELKGYKAEEETKILQAVTWALTEFPSIQQVKIRIEGKEMETMPVAGTPINQPLTRNDGINLEVSSSAIPGNTTAVTLYFEGETPEGTLQYFVPVTRLIPRTDNPAMATVEQLVKGPLPGSGLVSSLLPTTKIHQVKVDQGVALADFDEQILGLNANEAGSGKSISARSLDSVLLSLTATVGADKVQILVNGKTDALKEMKNYTQPVSKPKSINPFTF